MSKNNYVFIWTRNVQIVKRHILLREQSMPTITKIDQTTSITIYCKQTINLNIEKLYNIFKQRSRTRENSNSTI